MRNILLLLLLLGLEVSAQDALLYRISGNGNKSDCYLFGTIHMQDEKVFHWNQEVFNAIDACETAAFELDLDPKALMNEMDTAFFQKAFLYLAEDLVPALMEAYSPEELADNVIDHLLPFYQEILNGKSTGNQRLMFMDQYLQGYAERHGKTIWGIETMDEQFRALFGQDMQKLTDALIDVLSTEKLAALGSYGEQQEQLINYYASMNMKGVCSMVEMLGSGSNAWANSVYNRLLDDRNQVMVDRLKARMRTESVFIAVGAGHLCGPTGLVALLKKAGYSVSPIDHRSGSKDLKLVWKQYDTEGFTVDVPRGVDSIEYSDWNIFLPQMDNEGPRSLFTTHGLARFTVEDETASEWEGEVLDGMERPRDWEDSEISLDPENSETEESQVIEEGEYWGEDAEETEDVYVETMDDAPSPFGGILGSMDPQSYITPEMQTYFMSLLMQLQMKSPNIIESIRPSMEKYQETTVEERSIMVNGREETVVLEFGTFSNSATCTIELDGHSYVLSVEGDRSVVRSDEILKFFTSFRPK